MTEVYTGSGLNMPYIQLVGCCLYCWSLGAKERERWKVTAEWDKLECECGECKNPLTIEANLLLKKRYVAVFFGWGFLIFESGGVVLVGRGVQVAPDRVLHNWCLSLFVVPHQSEQFSGRWVQHGGHPRGALSPHPGEGMSVVWLWWYRAGGV